MRDPLYKIMFKVNGMKISDRCAYLIACIKCEPKDSSRRRELHKLLVGTRALQIASEIGVVAPPRMRSVARETT